jgi:hypothetical protein
MEKRTPLAAIWPLGDFHDVGRAFPLQQLWRK